MDALLKWFWSLFAAKKSADVIPLKPGTVIAPKPIEVVAPVQLKPSGKKTLGIDVSHYEPALDWSKAKLGGVEWMYTKATEGAAHVDSSLHMHVGSAKGAGVLTGAYHFFHANIDGAVQAHLYLKTVAGMNLELPHCLDWESSSSDGQSSAKQQLEAKKWLDIVEAATGKVPMIYGGLSHLKDLKLGPEFARYPLWLAHYGVSSTLVPAPWKEYTAWQFTDAGSVPGLASGHHVDTNWFNGSIEELRNFAKG